MKMNSAVVCILLSSLLVSGIQSVIDGWTLNCMYKFMDGGGGDLD
jgi:hypothetical protein